MVKKVIIVCECKSDYSYLNALQRFIENDLRTLLRFTVTRRRLRNGRPMFFSLPAGATNQIHRDCPMSSSEYAPQFQKVIPHYSKRKMPFSMSVDRLANLRRNLQDPDVKAMSALLQPGIEFGSRILELFDAAYPGLIP